jgi:hypothetical protein
MTPVEGLRTDAGKHNPGSWPHRQHTTFRQALDLGMPLTHRQEATQLMRLSGQIAVTPFSPVWHVRTVNLSIAPVRSRRCP